LEAISMITPESYGDNVEKRSIAQQQAATPMQKASVFFSKREFLKFLQVWVETKLMFDFWRNTNKLSLPFI
jgi:hypothetical protein